MGRQPVLDEKGNDIITGHPPVYGVEDPPWMHADPDDVVEPTAKEWVAIAIVASMLVGAVMYVLFW